MKLKPSDDGITAPPHIVKQLKNIDRGLELRFYRLVPQMNNQGYPLFVKKNEGWVDDQWEPIQMARWYLFLVEDSGRAHLIRPIHEVDGSFRPIDQRIVRETLTDHMRVLGLKENLRRMKEEIFSRGDKMKQAAKERHMLYEEANRSKIAEVSNDPFSRRKTHRDRRIASYAGQKNRGTSSDSIQLTDREQGFDKDFCKE